MIAVLTNRHRVNGLKLKLESYDYSFNKTDPFFNRAIQNIGYRSVYSRKGRGLKTVDSERILKKSIRKKKGQYKNTVQIEDFSVRILLKV